MIAAINTESVASKQKTSAISVPHVTLIIGDLIAIEQQAQFVVKCGLAMMLLLAGDVLLRAKTNGVPWLKKRYAQ